MATMDEALNDLTLFEELNDEYQFVLLSQVQRALRNLDAAIAGKEYARDGIYTSLYIIQKALYDALKDEDTLNG